MTRTKKLANNMTDKDLISKINKQLLQFSNRRRKKKKKLLKK